MEWAKVSQRTVKCRGCGERRFYIWQNGASTELRDATTGDSHVCSAPATPVERRTTVPKDVPAVEAVTVEGGDLIPPKAVLASYIPRKLDGKTDLETLETAYRVSVAHSGGTHLPECPKDCKGGPVNVLLVGDTGTGKNHLVAALAAKLGIPYTRIPLNGEIGRAHV